MRKGKACLILLSGILIPLFPFKPLLAADPAEEGGSVATDINEMKELIKAQQIQIEKLQSAVERQQRQLDSILRIIPAEPASKAASGSAFPPATDFGTQGNREKTGDVAVLKGETKAAAASAAQSDQRLSKVEAETAANKKELEARSKQLGNFNFSGDIRVRYEPFMQEGEDTRQRERFRARLNVTGKLSGEFSGGISLATGTLDDPISTNQTMTGFFNRENFGLDRAYITYRPNYAKFLKLDAGKFAFPWYRTPLTFDNDVNPEGFAETLSFNLNSSSFDNITFVGFQLPFNEVAHGQDSFVFGGQVQTHFRISPKVRMSLYGAGININRADPVAVSLANGTLKPSLPNSNTLRLDSSGAVVGYASRFAYLDTIMELGINTNARFPTTLLFNFVNNVRGPRERSAYWAELKVGRDKEAGDLLLSYAFLRIEKDAVIGAWNESDMRSSTNVFNHRLHFGYSIRGNVTGQFTAWIGRLANPQENVGLVPPGVRSKCMGENPSGCEDPYLKRLQLDLTYRF